MSKNGAGESRKQEYDVKEEKTIDYLDYQSLNNRGNVYEMAQFERAQVGLFM